MCEEGRDQGWWQININMLARLPPLFFFVFIPMTAGLQIQQHVICRRAQTKEDAWNSGGSRALDCCDTYLPPLLTTPFPWL